MAKCSSSLLPLRAYATSGRRWPTQKQLGNQAITIQGEEVLMPEVKEKQFTAEDVLKMIGEMAKANTEGQKQFAHDLAYLITHPEPSPEEKEREIQAAKQRVEDARVSEQGKKRR